MKPANFHFVNHAGDTHCQANPPVIPSRSRSLRLRCLEGMVSSGLIGGPPPPPPAPLPPPENNAIPFARSDNVDRRINYTCDTPRDPRDLSTSTISHFTSNRHNQSRWPTYFGWLFETDPTSDLENI